MFRCRGLVVTAAVLAVALTGCTGCTASSGPSTGESTVEVTVTQTLTRPPSSPSSAAPSSRFAPAPARSVAALGSANAPMPKGETEALCPYIANDAVADTVGSHVYRTAVITTTTPRGCRFYFYAAPFQAIADLVPTTLATPADAYNAMVATGKAGKFTLGVKNLVTGVDAVLFKTTFYGADGPDGDWACAFAKGRVLVVVHTYVTNTSFNARSLAAQVAPTF